MSVDTQSKIKKQSKNSGKNTAVSSDILAHKLKIRWIIIYLNYVATQYSAVKNKIECITEKTSQ